MLVRLPQILSGIPTIETTCGWTFCFDGYTTRLTIHWGGEHLSGRIYEKCLADKLPD